MSLEAKDALNRALKRIREREAMRLNWRVLDCSEGIPFETDEQFYYLQGHDNAGKPFGKPNYPVPATEPTNLFALWCMDPLDSDWNMRYGDWLDTQPID